MFLKKIRWRMAARKYAERLPRWLSRAFGTHEFYSEAQILRAIQECKLNPKFQILAYTTFLPKDEFVTWATSQPAGLSYLYARQIVLDQISVVATSHAGDAARNVVADLGALGRGLDQ